MDAKYWLLGALAVSGMGMGDAAAQVTAADYERAAKMLGDRTAPLVDGGVRGVAWLDDGSVVYGASAGGKTAWLQGAGRGDRQGQPEGQAGRSRQADGGRVQA